MLKLWGGEVITHSGEGFTAYHARLYALPEMPPPIFISGLGPDSTRLAARASQFVGGAACYAPDADEAKHVAHSRWRSSGAGGA